MGKGSKPSRNEVRARRDERAVRFAAQRVYGATVVDPLAQTWESQVVLFAESPEAAQARLQQAGFFARNSQLMRAEDLESEEFAFTETRPAELFLRRGHDFGWSRWYPLPPDYVHASKGSASAADLLPGEPAQPADEFSSPRWRPSSLRPTTDS